MTRKQNPRRCTVGSAAATAVFMDSAEALDVGAVRGQQVQAVGLAPAAPVP